jgi:hypothetical protein
MINRLPSTSTSRQPSPNASPLRSPVVASTTQRACNRWDRVYSKRAATRASLSVDISPRTGRGERQPPPRSDRPGPTGVPAEVVRDGPRLPGIHHGRPAPPSHGSPRAAELGWSCPLSPASLSHASRTPHLSARSAPHQNQGRAESPGINIASPSSSNTRANRAVLQCIGRAPPT